jgi:Domain of unknown function (DUF5658)
LKTDPEESIMSAALTIRWWDSSTPRARTRRMAQGICVLWLLSVADLFFTLWAHLFTPFHEVNPLAAVFLDTDQLAALVLMKLILTTVGATIFWRLRDHSRAEAALWLVVAAYVLLAVRWSAYTTGVMALAGGNVV